MKISTLLLRSLFQEETQAIKEIVGAKIKETITSLERELVRENNIDNILAIKVELNKQRVNLGKIFSSEILELDINEIEYPHTVASAIEQSIAEIYKNKQRVSASELVENLKLSVIQ